LLHIETMILALVIAATLAGHGRMDGEAAVEKSGKLLHEMGVTGPITLTKLLVPPTGAPDKNWRLSFDTRFGEADVQLDSETGKVARFRILIPAQEARYNKPPTSRETAFRARALRLLGYPDGPNTGSNIGFPERGPVHVLVHGHPFFNLNPTYAASLAVDPESGLAFEFYGSPPAPPVNASTQLIAAAAALERLRRWGHADALKKGLPKAVDPSEGVVAELGYWKFKDEPTARLVWRASKYSTVEGHRYGLGSLRMFVDALNGQMLKPDDAAWG
jgi:hypothetical protein